MVNQDFYQVANMFLFVWQSLSLRILNLFREILVLVAHVTLLYCISYFSQCIFPFSNLFLLFQLEEGEIDVRLNSFKGCVIQRSGNTNRRATQHRAIAVRFDEFMHELHWKFTNLFKHFTQETVLIVIISLIMILMQQTQECQLWPLFKWGTNQIKP